MRKPAIGPEEANLIALKALAYIAQDENRLRVSSLSLGLRWITCRQPLLAPSSRPPFWNT